MYEAYAKWRILDWQVERLDAAGETILSTQVDDW